MSNHSLQNYVVQLLGWSEEGAKSLNSDHKKWAVILIGPPGSGKGTQAELLAEKFGLSHLETSKIIEEKFKTSDSSDEVINKEKNNWLTGKLVNQTVVASWLIGELVKIARQGSGAVLSGSPRSIEELEGEIPVFEDLYGRDNVHIINIKLSEDESVKRNSGRRICQANRHPVPNFKENENLTACPYDGSPLIARELDKPETIRERYQVYLRTTEPVLEHFIKHGYKVIEINGDQPIKKVFEDIINEIV